MHSRGSRGFVALLRRPSPARQQPPTTRPAAGDRVQVRLWIDSGHRPPTDARAVDRFSYQSIHRNQPHHAQVPGTAPDRSRGRRRGINSGRPAVRGQANKASRRVSALQAARPWSPCRGRIGFGGTWGGRGRHGTAKQQPTSHGIGGLVTRCVAWVWMVLVRLARSVGIDAGGGREKTGEAGRALALLNLLISYDKTPHNHNNQTESAASWISSFCQEPQNQFFCEVERAFIEDGCAYTWIDR